MRFLIVFPLLAAAALAETSFLVAALGGPVPFGAVTALAVARMTAAPKRGLLAWIAAAALAAELFSSYPFGVAAAASVSAASSTRIILFTMLSHRSAAARALAAAAGVAIGSAALVLLRAVVTVWSGAGMASIGRIARTGAVEFLWTAAAAVSLSVAWTAFTRPVRPTIGRYGVP